MDLLIVGSYADRHHTCPCMGLYPIQLAADTRRPTVEPMGIDRWRFDIAIPQQLLDGSNAYL